MIIPSADDYFWWGNKGLYLLRHNFFSTNIIYDGSSNGRYLGNLSEILIMHSPLFAVLFYALTITLLIWCIYELSGRNISSLIISLSLFFIVQIGYLQSVFLWYAGFVNYLPPVALLLLACVLFKRYLNADLNNYLILSLSMFAISLCGGLFVEHFNLYQLLVGILAIILTNYLSDDKKIIKIFSPACSYLFGAIISTVIMFSNPSYLDNHGAYRKAGFTFMGALHNYIYYTHFWIATFNYLIIISICISIIIIVKKEIENSTLKNLLISISTIFIIYYTFISIYLHTSYKIDYLYEVVNLPFELGLIDAIEGFLFYLFLLISTLILFRKKSVNNIFVYFYLFSSVSLFIPFIFIISPVYSREYFGAFIFLFIICIIYIDKAQSYIDIKIKRTMNLTLGALILSLSLFVLFAMSKNAKANIERTSNENFLYNYAILKKKVPYTRYVFADDIPIMQAPEYYRHRLNYNWKDYIYNN